MARINIVWNENQPVPTEVIHNLIECYNEHEDEIVKLTQQLNLHEEALITVTEELLALKRDLADINLLPKLANLQQDYEV